MGYRAIANDRHFNITHSMVTDLGPIWMDGAKYWVLRGLSTTPSSTVCSKLAYQGIQIGMVSIPDVEKQGS